MTRIRWEPPLIGVGKNTSSSQYPGKVSYVRPTKSVGGEGLRSQSLKEKREGSNKEIFSRYA